MKSVISAEQLPHCPVCNLQPVPQSAQHIILLIIEIALIFVNIKFSIIVLMLGYSFPRTIWKCPFCSRQVQDINKDNQIENNIILRMGNCMALFSLNKFRVLAGIIIVICMYLYIQQPKYKPTVTLENNWESLISNCGYEAYIENSFRANHFYSLYDQNGKQWELQGIYMQKSPARVADYYYLKIKMDPSQFKQSTAEDFRMFMKINQKFDIKKGDIIKIKGIWEGRQDYHLIFIPSEIKKTGRNKDPTTVDYFYKQKSMLRSHLQSVKEQIKNQDNNQQQK